MDPRERIEKFGSPAEKMVLKIDDLCNKGHAPTGQDLEPFFKAELEKTLFHLPQVTNKC